MIEHAELVGEIRETIRTELVRESLRLAPNDWTKRFTDDQIEEKLKRIAFAVARRITAKDRP